jgi:two-component system, cell cycle sensor histidine kinase and response regulator CckA
MRRRAAEAFGAWIALALLTIVNLGTDARWIHVIGTIASFAILAAVFTRSRRRFRQMEAKLQQLNAELADRVAERTDELERSQEQLLHAQKMEAVGRLAGGIAHDFNNLMTVILGHTEILGEALPEGDPARADLEDVKVAGERAAALTRQLLAFSRQQVLAPKVVSMNDVIAGTHKLLSRVIGEDVELRTIESTTAQPVCVDRGQIEQVLMNLAVNARDAMPRGGTLTLEISSTELDGSQLNLKAGHYTTVAVTDTGHGMNELTKARIFEPFFTTKAPGKGTGLGLSTVFGIVRQSGGAVAVDSEPGKGATFTLYFPVASADRTTSARVPRPALPRGTESVLLVEDEEGVRSLVRKALSRSGYRVLEASDGEQALRVAEEHSGEIDLLLSDVVMPRMSGGELLAKVAVARPRMKVLFMSGYTDDTIIHHGIDRDFAFIQKPVTSDQLMRKIRSVLEAG